MMILATSFAERAITIGDVAIVSGFIVGGIILCVVGYVILSIIAKGWDH